MSITAPIPTDAPRLDIAEMREAREWIEDVFEEAPCDLDSIEVERAIANHYVGGLVQFAADGATR